MFEIVIMSRGEAKEVKNLLPKGDRIPNYWLNTLSEIHMVLTEDAKKTNLNSKIAVK